MNQLLQRLFLSLTILIFSFSCSQSNPDLAQKAEKKENQKEKEQKLERHPTSLFPMVIAGSIGIIQEVYFNKED